MEAILTIVFGLLAATAVIAWFVAAFSTFGMLVNARDGRWIRILFHPGWWNRSRADEFVNPPGLAHRRRLMAAVFVFMAAILAGLVVVMIQISMQP